MQESTREQAPVVEQQPAAPAAPRRAARGPAAEALPASHWAAHLPLQRPAPLGSSAAAAAAHASLLSDQRLSLAANATRREDMVTELQQRYGNWHVQRVLANVRSLAPRTVVQREDQAPAEAGPEAEAEKEEEAKAANSLSIDEEGVTQSAFPGPNFSTHDQKVTAPAAGAPKDSKLVDVAAKVSATFKVVTKVSLPAVPDGLNECQKKRVKDAIDNKLAPHEQAHVKAFEMYDGAFTGNVSVTSVMPEAAADALSAAGQIVIDTEAERRKGVAEAASALLDNPPFIIEVDLNCKDEKKEEEKKEPKKPVQKAAADGADGGEPDADSGLAAELQRQSGGGQPLDSSLRERMEAGLAHDLSSVRVHTGPEAQDLSARLEARAFTSASEIWLGEDASPLDPGLMAHELAHVVQQSQGPVHGVPVGGLSVSEPGDAFEQAAEETARGVLAGQAPTAQEAQPAAEAQHVTGAQAPVQRQHHNSQDTPERRQRAQRVASALGSRVTALNAQAADLESVGYPEEAGLDRASAGRLQRLQTRLDEIGRGERNEEPPTVEECWRIADVRLPQESGIMFATESFAVQAGRLINSLDEFITAKQNSASEAETAQQRDFYTHWADRLTVYRERIRDLIADPPSNVAEQQRLLMNVMVYVNITRPGGGGQQVYTQESAPPDEATAAQVRQTVDGIMAHIRGLERQAQSEPIGPSIKRFQLEYLHRERIRLLGSLTGMRDLYTVDVGRLGADYYADSLTFAQERMEQHSRRREADPTVIQGRLRANLATFRRRTGMLRLLMGAIQRERQRLEDIQFGFRLIQACELIQSAGELALMAPTRMMNMPNVPSNLITLGGDAAGFAGVDTGPLVGSAGGTGASIIQFMLDSGLADRLTQRREALHCLGQEDLDIEYCAELAEMNVAGTLQELETLGRQIEEDTQRLQTLGAASAARDGEAAP